MASNSNNNNKMFCWGIPSSILVTPRPTVFAKTEDEAVDAMIRFLSAPCWGATYVEWASIGKPVITL